MPGLLKLEIENDHLTKELSKGRRLVSACEGVLEYSTRVARGYGQCS